MDDNVVVEGKIEMFLDTDNDGYGDTLNSVFRCDLQDGYVEHSGDCDEENVLIKCRIIMNCAMV